MNVKEYQKALYDEIFDDMSEKELEAAVMSIDFCRNDEERRLMKEPIRSYGRKWQEWIDDFYPEVCEVMKATGRFWVIPRIIDKEASEMWADLSKSYDDAYYSTRPDDSDTLAVIRWQTEKTNYIDHQITSLIVYSRTREGE